MRPSALTVAIMWLLVSLTVVHAKNRGYSAPPCWAGTSDVPACAAYNAYVHQTIREHTPHAATLGYGDAAVGFKVLPSGRVTVIEYSGSTPAHVDMALWILKSIRLRPPPGPYALERQRFAFH
ncbi:MAG: hypothetical protein AB7F41_12805 [Methylocystis sp.]|uniref:hypothetical protein n=1 Tax=Methylocystis sp. TaxID=1911079 RepID=UPI003D0E308C